MESSPSPRPRRLSRGAALRNAARQRPVEDAGAEAQRGGIIERVRAVRAEREEQHRKINDGTADAIVYDTLEVAYRVAGENADSLSADAKEYAAMIVLDRLGQARREGATPDACALGELAGRELHSTLEALRKPPLLRSILGFASDTEPIRSSAERPPRPVEQPVLNPLPLEAVAARLHEAGKADRDADRRDMRQLIGAAERTHAELVESNEARRRAEFEAATAKRGERRWRLYALCMSATLGIPGTLVALDKLHVI